MIEHLLNEARRLLSQEPSAIQVNLFAAADGQIYSFYRYDLESEAQEDACLQQMEANNAQTQSILCMWNNGTIDMLRYSLRKKLTERYPEARLLLFGEQGITAFPLTMIK